MEKLDTWCLSKLRYTWFIVDREDPSVFTSTPTCSLEQAVDKGIVMLSRFGTNTVDIYLDSELSYDSEYAKTGKVTPYMSIRFDRPSLRFIGTIRAPMCTEEGRFIP
jgi:hypothetical protein